MGRSREITGLVASIVTLLAMGAAVARDATWKDCELAARDPDRSIVACSKILKRPSSQAHAAAFHHRGQAYAAKGNLDQAISDISAGIRLDPERAYRWQERGQLYARQGKYQQAIADFTEAIRRDSTPRAFRFQHRAEAYQGLGDLTRAIADYDEAIRLDPEARSFRFYARANALRDAGQYDRALADYETALKLAPTDAWILVDRGRTYARMGRSEAAKNDFDSALRLDPANEERLRPIIEKEVAALPATVQKPPPQSPPPQQPSATSGTSPTRQNPAAFAQGGSISSRPTFDCGKAKSPLALLICSGEETARADWDLKIAYWARYFLLDKDDRGTFWEDQDKWFGSLNEKCRLSAPPFPRQQTSCVVGAYKERAALYRSKMRGDALAESKMTPEQLSQIQQALITLGFFNGEADGKFGPVTRAAIRKYQQANGFPQSDYLSMEQRQALASAPSTVPLSQGTPPQSSPPQQPAPAQRAEDKLASRSGNGCGGLGVVTIDEIEKIATEMNATGPRNDLERDHPEIVFNDRLNERMQRLQQPPPSLNKLDEKMIRECLPNYSKLIDNLMARRDEAKRRVVEAERQAKLAINRLKNAYHLYSMVQLCHQIREGNIYEPDLQRGRTVSKAIEKASIAEDPTIDPDKVFAEADKWARERLTNAGPRICATALTDLLNLRPGAAFPTQRP